MPSRNRNTLLRVVARSSALLLATFARGDDWTAWRGPNGTGEAVGDGPLHWSDEAGVRWVRGLPGRGCSTPIVVGDLIVLTAAIDVAPPSGAETGGSDTPGDDPEPPKSQASEGFIRARAAGLFGEQSFVVLAIERASGAIAWIREVNRAWPHEGHHLQYGSFASRSVVSDGERFFASFGSFGVYCLDGTGEIVWRADPGVKLAMRHGHGEGSSPALHGDRLVHVFDHEEGSFLVAWDKRTGEELWRTPRDEPSTWAQPLVIEHGGRPQVVVNGENAVRSYDLATGAELWSRTGLGRAVVASPVRCGELVIGMTAFQKSTILAVRLGGEGVLGEQYVAWRADRGAAYTASPLLLGGDLFVVTDNGQISCFDAATGTPHYLLERLPRGTRVKASPVHAGGKIYVATEDGAVHVLAAKADALEVFATNVLEDEEFIASPVVVDGLLFLRSMRRLYCIDGAPAQEREH